MASAALTATPTSGTVESDGGDDSSGGMAGQSMHRVFFARLRYVQGDGVTERLVVEMAVLGSRAVTETGTPDEPSLPELMGTRRRCVMRAKTGNGSMPQ